MQEIDEIWKKTKTKTNEDTNISQDILDIYFKEENDVFEMTPFTR